mmetsp:Transcript_69182/g.165889  ORF Transcript_69182/g.165889 Transcript_69182/m.165889 type:complete len:188 (-) Transcript_69182:70-633(-)
MMAPWYRDPKYYYNQVKNYNYNHNGENEASLVMNGFPYAGCHAKSRLVHCVVACLVRGGKIVTPGLAMCSEGSPRLRPHVARLLQGRQPKTMTQHAEIAALNRLPEGITLKELHQMTLVVVRPKYSHVTRKTRLLCAAPCRECAKVIVQLGIKAVIYSDDDRLLRRTPGELLGASLPSSGTEWLMRD